MNLASSSADRTGTESPRKYEPVIASTGKDMAEWRPGRFFKDDGRKLVRYLAKAMVVMPGGFGTLDEFMEVVTLVQTLKIKKKMPIVLFGTEYWDEVLHLDPMVKYGTISADDVKLFFRTNSVDEAYDYVTRELELHALKKIDTSYMSDKR